MTLIYDHPRYYDIAFSFRDLELEVNVMEESMQWFAGGRGKRVLELACGHAPHAKEWVRRGYEYVGLDLNDSMLDYARERTASLGERVQLIRADMADFKLPEPVDFAYVMLASIYIETSERLVSHFDCVADALKPGGLYFLDWCIEFEPFTSFANAWEEERNGVKIRTSYLANLVDRVEQILEENITFEIDDHGEHKTIRQTVRKRAIYPQEFLTLLKWRDRFEFVGWWNDWDLTVPVDGRDTITRPVTIIRRK
jgi:SAM-dependent methyltransferase